MILQVNDIDCSNSIKQQIDKICKNSGIEMHFLKTFRRHAGKSKTFNWELVCNNFSRYKGFLNTSYVLRAHKSVLASASVYIAFICKEKNIYRDEQKL